MVLISSRVRNELVDGGAKKRKHIKALTAFQLHLHCLLKNVVWATKLVELLGLGVVIIIKVYGLK